MSAYVYDIIYREIFKEHVRKTLSLINKLSKVVGYKTQITQLRFCFNQ